MLNHITKPSFTWTCSPCEFATEQLPCMGHVGFIYLFIYLFNVAVFLFSSVWKATVTVNRFITSKSKWNRNVQKYILGEFCYVINAETEAIRELRNRYIVEWTVFKIKLSCVALKQHYKLCMNIKLWIHLTVIRSCICGVQILGKQWSYKGCPFAMG